MVDTFQDGGIMMWLLLAVGIGIAVLAVRTAARLGRTRGGERPPAEIGRQLEAILFWGGMAVLLGILGTVVGLVIAAQAIALAGSVEPALVWAGVGVSMVTLVFGLLIFLFASLSWFTLRQWSLRAAR